MTEPTFLAPLPEELRAKIGPSYTGAYDDAICDPLEQQARQDHIDALYLKDDRDNPENAHCWTYTGLAKKYADEKPA